MTGRRGALRRHGPFRRAPISRAWNFVVLPSLVLNYAGQAAIVLEGAPTEGNIFYRLCPPLLLTPLILLATVATVIASQSIITGAFSMTRQAIQLGWLPRLRITQTSEEGYGQIYVGAVNWLLMLVTLGADDRLRQIRQSRLRLRHRGGGDHADDERAAVHRDARDLGLVDSRPPARSPAPSSSSTRAFSRPISPSCWTAAMCRCSSRRPSMALMWTWHHGMRRCASGSPPSRRR